MDSFGCRRTELARLPHSNYDTIFVLHIRIRFITTLTQKSHLMWNREESSFYRPNDKKQSEYAGTHTHAENDFNDDSEIK